MNSILVSYAFSYIEIGKNNVQFIYPKEYQVANSTALLTAMV